MSASTAASSRRATASGASVDMWLSFAGHGGQQILIVEVRLLLGDLLEPAEGLAQRILGDEPHAEPLHLGPEPGAPGVLAEHQLVVLPADDLGGHDLISERVLQHPVLVDARLVRER